MPRNGKNYIEGRKEGRKKKWMAIERKTHSDIDLYISFGTKISSLST